MNKLLVLVRREFWEHRSLWIAPLCVSLVILLVALTGRMRLELPGHVLARWYENEFAPWMLVLAAFQYVIAMIVVAFYLLDCLYSERRDRSILFWKSLPISDLLTVLSKFLVAIVVVPVLVYVIALVTNLLFSTIWSVRVTLGPGDALNLWNGATWLKAQLVLLICVAFGALWYAPVAAYLMLISVWARRGAVVWATIPIVILMIAEAIAFDTGYVRRFVSWRLTGIWKQLFGTGAHGSGELYGIDFAGVLSSPGLWLGLIVAAVLLYATIRIRQFRDET